MCHISDLCTGTQANVSLQGLAFTESPFTWHCEGGKSKAAEAWRVTWLISKQGPAPQLKIQQDLRLALHYDYDIGQDWSLLEMTLKVEAWDKHFYVNWIFSAREARRGLIIFNSIEFLCPGSPTMAELIRTLLWRELMFSNWTKYGT
jgi:hypothetical protein